jgi:hypothetical protein
VHDELLIEVWALPAIVASVRTIVVQEMTAAFLAVFLDAPTLNLMTPTIGRSWGEQCAVDEWLSDGVPA